MMPSEAFADIVKNRGKDKLFGAFHSGHHFRAMRKFMGVGGMRKAAQIFNHSHCVLIDRVRMK